MSNKDKSIKIYSGKEILVHILKARLEENQISSVIQNDSNDGFLRGVPAAVDLYIRQSDLEKAGPVIREFLENN